MPAHDSFRRYGSIRILRDGSVHFSPWIFPGLRYLSFIADENSISVERANRTVLYLFLTRNRVTSACFPYDLSPDELRAAISDLRRAGHGLERWIVPGLEHNQASSTVKEERPDMHRLIPEFLQSVEGLPVAEAWKRTRRKLQREWAEWLREHPADVVKVPAPWLLPDGFLSAKEGSRARSLHRRSPRPAKSQKAIRTAKR